MKFLFIAKDRINRTQYWAYQAISIISLLLLSLLANILPEPSNSMLSGIGILFLPIFLLWIYSSYVIAIKRFHDTNRSGWNVLWGLIPCVGGIYVFVVLGFFRGDADKNKYGPAIYEF